MTDFGFSGSDSLCIYIDKLETKSEANNGDHWAVKNKRRELQKAKVREHIDKIAPFELLLPLVITITRHCPAKNMIRDSDNLVSCAKSIRDGIAKCLNTNDSDPAITWDVKQEPAPGFGVTVQIERRTHECKCIHPGCERKLK
jgi:hypothetical protein